MIVQFKQASSTSFELKAPLELVDALERNFAVFRSLLILEVPPKSTTYQTFLSLVRRLKQGDFDCKLVLDFTSIEGDCSSEANQMVNFILHYDVRPEWQAKAFNRSFTDFAKFRKLAQATKLSEKLHLSSGEQELFISNPILVLLDIGGSILYRDTDRKLSELPRKPDFTIRKHHHFFRPHYEEFISALLMHPRAKLAFYTSITQKNALPLLMQVFESPKLKPLRANLFGLFD